MSMTLNFPGTESVFCLPEADSPKPEERQNLTRCSPLHAEEEKSDSSSVSGDPGQFLLHGADQQTRRTSRPCHCVSTGQCQDCGMNNESPITAAVFLKSSACRMSAPAAHRRWGHHPPAALRKGGQWVCISPELEEPSAENLHGSDFFCNAQFSCSWGFLPRTNPRNHGHDKLNLLRSLQGKETIQTDDRSALMKLR